MFGFGVPEVFVLDLKFVECVFFFLACIVFCLSCLRIIANFECLELLYIANKHEKDQI